MHCSTQREKGERPLRTLCLDVKAKTRELPMATRRSSIFLPFNIRIQAEKIASSFLCAKNVARNSAESTVSKRYREGGARGESDRPLLPRTLILSRQLLLACVSLLSHCSCWGVVWSSGNASFSSSLDCSVRKRPCSGGGWCFVLKGWCDLQQPLSTNKLV